MTAEIKLPPMPEWAKMDNLNGMVPSEIRSALSEFACEAVRLNAQGGSVAPQLAVSPYLLSDIRELAAYAEGSKSPRMVHASRAAFAWLEGAQLAEPVNRKRRYAQGTALGEFGIIPMCDQVDDEPVKVPGDAISVVGMPEFDALMDHIYENGTASEGVLPLANAFARAILARAIEQAHGIGVQND